MVSHLNLSVMDTDDLAPSLREELIRLCIAAFQKDNFANLFVYFPTGRRHFLAHLGERLIGHAVVTMRWVQPQGARVLRTAYVDAVAIAPDLQRQGFGTQLMEYLGREIADYELGCLATRSPGFMVEWAGKRGEDRRRAGMRQGCFKHRIKEARWSSG